MALLTSDGISRLGVSLLKRSLVLPMTVSRAPSEEFSGDNGDTINVRVRQPATPQKQTTPGATLTYEGRNEVSVPVTVYHVYNGTTLNDYELSLELEDFGFQVAEPQIDAVSTGAENELGTVFNDVVSDDLFVEADPGSTAGQAETKAHLRAAREALSAADVPAGSRYVAASPSAYTRIMAVDDFVKVDSSGADTALRRAIVGSIYGFTVLESNALEDGSMVAYHSSGFAFANVTPVAPRGATESAAFSDQGIGIRHIFDYNAANATDRSLMSTFAGASVVDADRIYKVGESS